MVRNQRVGILLSGRPGQRELSLRQAEAISSALASLGHETVPVFMDAEPDLAIRQAQVSVAFLALQGRQGADGAIQGFLETVGIPYTGAGVLACALAGDLVKTKALLRLHSLPNVAGYVYDASAGEALSERHGAFGYPVTVRPVTGGSGIESAPIYDEDELETQVEECLQYGDRVLVERASPGRLMTVAVVDGVPLGVVAGPKAGQSTRGPTRRPTPTPGLPADRLRSVLRLAAVAYDALSCDGPATVAIQVSERGNEMVRYVETNPVLTPTADLARGAHAAGVEYSDLISRVLEGARLRAHGRRDSQRHVQVDFDGPDRRRDALPEAH